MDCVVVSTRMAAFLDGELAPAEAEQFTLHIERCDSCAQVVIQMEAQRFMPLSAHEKTAICGVSEFWASMDSSLTEELNQMASPTGGNRTPWYERQVGLPAPMAVMYAAAMLLAVAWGMQQQERAQLAEGSAEHLGKQLEQERRIVVQPASGDTSSGSSRYKVVNYVPQSGTF